MATLTSTSERGPMVTALLNDQASAGCVCRALGSRGFGNGVVIGVTPRSGADADYLARG